MANTNSRVDQTNDPNERLAGGSYNNYRVPAHAVHGTEDNLARRVGGLTTAGFVIPDRLPTTFVQLGPQSPRGDANSQRAVVYRGGSKFGDSRRYG